MVNVKSGRFMGFSRCKGFKPVWKTGRMPVLLLAALRDEAVAANLSISADFVDGVLDFAFNGFTIGAF